jgi:hypothetical protein
MTIDSDGSLFKRSEVFRLIGIAASPAMYSVRGQRFTSELMGGMTLEFGPELHDSEGQLLEYVLLGDGHCYDAELIRRGFARTISDANHPRIAEFLEIEARRPRNVDGRILNPDESVKCGKMNIVEYCRRNRTIAMKCCDLDNQIEKLKRLLKSVTLENHSELSCKAELKSVAQ